MLFILYYMILYMSAIYSISFLIIYYIFTEYTMKRKIFGDSRWRHKLINFLKNN